MIHRGGTEGTEKKSFYQKYSDLCELSVSAVKIPSFGFRILINLKPDTRNLKPRREIL